MCELMGMSFQRPVSADFSIREFALRSVENADGWGLAWYPDRSLALIKEAVKWRSSKHTGFLESYPEVRSRIYLGHVRHKTVGGEVTHADTHPFARELRGSEHLVNESVAALAAAGVVELGETGIRYGPQSSELGTVVTALVELYGQKPLAVLRAIFTSPSEKIRSFSDAFLFQKK